MKNFKKNKDFWDFQVEVDFICNEVKGLSHGANKKRIFKEINKFINSLDDWKDSLQKESDFLQEIYNKK